ncbi:hypothetical protein N7466_001622 [Penicillium verhagenii]|uniref:uncharacterized protein n=1 Tax=Penicillium verhagenii TaxID=1562060 RepID=UPI002544FD04|nr:uncharacterized protein N7466_001622 [Penicillium verhagenii]KAJ5938488.1 hypothetical protein N7466_001622 [Penicillium verhagenii]
MPVLIFNRLTFSTSTAENPSVPRSPYIYSKTEELVWKWEQLKLCGQSIKSILQCATLPSRTVVNKPDNKRVFICVEDGVTTVLPLAKATSLQTSDYHLGISCATDEKDRKLIILGVGGKEKISTVRKMTLHVWKSICETRPLVLYSWSTEYWVSDSVVIDARSIEDTDMMKEAIRAGRSATKAYVCIGLPAITFGPLFNTLVSGCNVNAACFNLAILYIWMAAAVDPTRLEIEREEGAGSFHKFFLSIINDETQGSWLVEAKLQFWLESSSRMRASVLAELLEMRDIRITSTHRPCS